MIKQETAVIYRIEKYHQDEGYLIWDISYSVQEPLL